MIGVDGSSDETDDAIPQAEIERVLRVVPRGALAVAGGAVVIMLLAWLFVYFAVFLPRGPVN